MWIHHFLYIFSFFVIFAAFSFACLDTEYTETVCAQFKNDCPAYANCYRNQPGCEDIWDCSSGNLPGDHLLYQKYKETSESSFNTPIYVAAVILAVSAVVIQICTRITLL